MDKPKRNARNLPPTFARMIKSNAQLSVRPLGRPMFRTPDVYHQLLRASWLRLTLYFLSAFFLFNCAFAGLFMFDLAGFTQPSPQIAAPEFWQLFFFSIETVATVGYGNMVPLSLYANILVAIEISLGILFLRWSPASCSRVFRARRRGWCFRQSPWSRRSKAYRR